MYCVFLVKTNHEKIFLDFFKTENSARRYMDTFKRLKIDGEVILDYVAKEALEERLK